MSSWRLQFQNRNLEEAQHQLTSESRLCENVHLVMPCRRIDHDCTLLCSVFSAAVGDFEKIWREHCEDEQTLSEYAMAMKNLADNHWVNKCEGEGRIEWCRRYECLWLVFYVEKLIWYLLLLNLSCRSVCQEYFQDGGMRRVLEKDEKSARHAADGNNTSANSPPQSSSSRCSRMKDFNRI